jgi:hypothetical protein
MKKDVWFMVWVAVFFFFFGDMENNKIQKNGHQNKAPTALNESWLRDVLQSLALKPFLAS